MNNENNNMSNDYEENEKLIKKSKFKKKPILISSIAGVVIIICVIAFMVINNNPKVKVFKAITATKDEIDKEATFSQDMTGMDDFTELYLSKTNIEIGSGIKSSNMPDLAKLKGFGIKGNIASDEANKKYMFDFDGQYNGTSIANMQGYSDNKKFMFSVPALYNSWFTFDAEHVQDQYNSSIFGRYSRVPNKEVSFKAFGDEETRTVGIKKLNEQFIKIYLENNKSVLTNITKNIKVEKGKDSKEISIGGNSEKCNEYTVSIPSDDVNKFMDSVYDYVLNDKQGQIVMNEYFGNGEFGYINNLFPKLGTTGKWKDEINYLKSNVIFDDAAMKVYVDSKGRAAEMDLDTKYNVDNQKFSVSLSSEYKGKDNIGDDIKASIVVNDGNKDTRCDATYNKKNDGTNTENIYALALANDNTRMSGFNMDSKYDKDKKTLEGKLSVDEKGSTVSIDYKGNYDFDKADNKMKFDFDDVNINSTVKGTKMNIDCDASFAVEPYDKDIDEPSGEKLELFKLNQGKILQIAQEVRNNYSKIAGALN